MQQIQGCIVSAVPPVSKRAHRIAVSVLFYIQGLGFASWASRIPAIQQKLDLSEAELGMVLFAIPVGLMLSLPFAGWLTAKYGSKKIALTSAFFYGIILVCIGFSSDIFELTAALFLFGIFGNMANIAINTQAVGVEVLYNKSIMASFHGLWSIAGFFGAAIGTLMIGFNVAPGLHFAGIFLLLTGGIISASKYVINEDSSDGDKHPLFAKPDKALLMLGLIAFCIMICEGSMFDWSGVYFKKVVRADKAWIGAGYTAFMGTMAAGRFVADRFNSKYGLPYILIVSGILASLGLLIAIIFPYLASAIFGFMLVGFGVSSVVPLVYGAAGKSKTLSPGIALAAVSTIGFAGFLIGPPLIGIIAAAFSLRISFTVIAVMAFCVVLLSSKVKVN